MQKRIGLLHVLRGQSAARTHHPRTGPVVPRRIIAPAALAVMLLLAACSDSSNNLNPASEVVTMDRIEMAKTECRFEVPATADTTCYNMPVPQRWDEPANVSTMTLHVAVLINAGAKPLVHDAEPTLYLSGGPGLENLSTLPEVWDVLWADLAMTRPLVMFDQRGVGYSKPRLDCPELGALAENATAEATLGAWEICAGQLRDSGVDFRAYNAVDVTHDTEAIAKALGYDRWSAIGISWGTNVAQTTLWLEWHLNSG